MCSCASNEYTAAEGGRPKAANRVVWLLGILAALFELRLQALFGKEVGRNAGVEFATVVEELGSLTAVNENRNLHRSLYALERAEIRIGAGGFVPFSGLRI